MYYIIFAYLSFLILLFILAVSVYIGHEFGKYQLVKYGKTNLEVVGVAEGSIFGILGLLVAFTFSGAYERYEHRKAHLLDEAGAYERAFAYTYMVEPKSAEELRQLTLQYLNTQMALRESIPYEEKMNHYLQKGDELEHKIWTIIVQVCNEHHNANIVQVIAPAFQNMFEEANMGFNITKIHPPWIIFFLLISLSCLGGFLTGYNSAENHKTDRLHMHSVCYVVLTAFLIYVIANIEYPRLGFIRLNSFDLIVKEIGMDWARKQNVKTTQ